MANFTVLRLIGSGQAYTTLAAHEADAPADYTTAEKSAAGTFLTASFIQNESLTFVGSGATGKFLDTDSTGPGTGTYIAYAITTGNPAASDVVTGGTSAATCVLSSGTPTNVGCVWQGKINAATDAFSGSTNLLTIAGGTTSSTAYFELTTNTGASFRDNANVQTNALRWNSSNGCSITSTAGSAKTVSDSQNYTRLSNLQIQLINIGNNQPALSTSGRNILWENLIVESVTPAAVAWYFATSAIVIKNSLFIQRSSNILGIIKNPDKLGVGNNNIYNCTFVVPSDLTAAGNCFHSTGYETINTFACNFFGVSAIKDAGTFTHTSGFSNLSGTTGITQATYNTSQFVNITDSTRDYRLPSGSAMIDTYTADTTNSPIDIAGTTRPTGANQADAGCWEFVAAATDTLFAQICM